MFTGTFTKNCENETNRKKYSYLVLPGLNTT